KHFQTLHHDYSESPLVAIQLAPANLHWCSDEALYAISSMSQEYCVPMHMHLLETPFQKRYWQRTFGQSAVEHLAALDLLGPSLTLAHCVWVTDRDLRLIRDSGSLVCHNPSSNLRWKNGVAPAAEMNRMGIELCLGTDGATIDD